MDAFIVCALIAVMMVAAMWLNDSWESVQRRSYEDGKKDGFKLAISALEKLRRRNSNVTGLRFLRFLERSGRASGH